MKLFVNGKEQGISEKVGIHSVNNVVYRPNNKDYLLVVYDLEEEVYTYLDLSNSEILTEGYDSLEEMDETNPDFIAVESEFMIIHRK